MDIEKGSSVVGEQEQKKNELAKFRAQAEEVFLKLKGTKPTEADESRIKELTDIIASWSKLAEKMGFDGNFVHFIEDGVTLKEK